MKGLRMALLNADNPDPDSHFENSMVEVLQGFSAREGDIYAKAIASCMSIINMGQMSLEGKAMSLQVATILNELDPIKFNLDKMEADLRTLFRFQNEAIMKRMQQDGPTPT